MSWRTVVITGNAKLDYKMEYVIGKKGSTIIDSDQRTVIL